MNENLKNLCTRLERRIASAVSLSPYLVSDEVRESRDELQRVIEIPKDPNAAMGKRTVGHAAANAEMAIDELCDMERRYLVSASVARELKIRTSKIEARQAETWTRFRVWRSLAEKAPSSVTTQEIREAYMNLIGVLCTAENESIKVRVRSVIAPPPPVVNSKNRYHRSLYDVELRLKMKGDSPPADKRGHGKRARVKA